MRIKCRFLRFLNFKICFKCLFPIAILCHKYTKKRLDRRQSLSKKYFQAVNRRNCHKEHSQEELRDCRAMC